MISHGSSEMPERMKSKGSGKCMDKSIQCNVVHNTTLIISYEIKNKLNS